MTKSDEIKTRVKVLRKIRFLCEGGAFSACAANKTWAKCAMLDVLVWIMSKMGDLDL